MGCQNSVSKNCRNVNNEVFEKKIAVFVLPLSCWSKTKTKTPWGNFLRSLLQNPKDSGTGQIQFQRVKSALTPTLLKSIPIHLPPLLNCDTFAKVCPPLGRKQYIRNPFISRCCPHLYRDTLQKYQGQGVVGTPPTHLGDGPNTVLESTVSNTGLSEFFGLTEFRGANSVSSSQPIIFCAKANSPSFFCRTHRVCPKLSEAQ